MVSIGSDLKNDSLRGFSFALILIGIICLSTGLLIISPFWRLLVIKSYIVAQEQLEYARHWAVLTGIFNLTMSALLIVGGAGIFRLSARQKISAVAINISTGFITAILFIFNTEGILRVMRPHGDNIFQLHSERNWTLRPNSEGRYFDQWIKINSLGYRGIELIEKDPTEDIQQWAFLGNSIAFGFKIDDADLAAVKLEKLLNDSDLYKYRVAVLGVPGYGLLQEKGRLKDFSEYHFDRVLLGFCYNDLANRYEYSPLITGELFRKGEKFNFNSLLLKVKFFFRDETAIGYNLDRLYGTIKSRVVGQNRFRETEEKSGLSDILNGNQTEKADNLWRSTLAEMDSINVYTQSKNIPMTLLIFPYQMMYDPRVNVNYKEPPEAHLVEWAERNRIDYIDFVKVYADSMAEENLTISELFLDEGHPTVRGNELIANTIFAHFKKMQGNIGQQR